MFSEQPQPAGGDDDGRLQGLCLLIRADTAERVLRSRVYPEIEHSRNGLCVRVRLRLHQPEWQQLRAAVRFEPDRKRN